MLLDSSTTPRQYQRASVGLAAAISRQSRTGRHSGRQANDAANAGANATLQAEAQRRGIPVQASGFWRRSDSDRGLGLSIDGAITGTQQMSGAQQFGLISGGIGNLLKGFGSLNGPA